MIKFELDPSFIAELERDLNQGLRSTLNSAVASVAEGAKAEAGRIAKTKLKRGLTFWERGFTVDKMGDGEWLISLTGKLANMMEEGFGVGEIKDMLLSGNRAKTNAKTGKKYVDVPIGLDSDAVTGKIGKSQLSVSQFKDADELLKSIKTSDWKKGGVKREQVITSRIKDIIQTRKKGQAKGDARFITIRRVSEKSKGWPANPFAGAHVFEQLDGYLERAFEESLDRLA